jgi:hypothetical protein
MKKFRWYDWLIGLSPLLALLADICFNKPITRVIFGVSLVFVIGYYLIRDFKTRRNNWNLKRACLESQTYLIL